MLEISQLAVALHQQRRVPASLRGSLRRRDRRLPFFLGDLGAEELDRLGLDLQLDSRAGGERLRQPLLDQGTPSIPRAVGLDDLRILGEPRDQCLGRSLVVVLNEGLIGREDGLLVRGELRLGSRPAARPACRRRSFLTQGKARRFPG